MKSGMNLSSPSVILPEDRTFLYERPRIRKLLSEGMKKPLVCVVAGAGYGKSRAVYSFLRTWMASITWIQLSDRDNVGSRFWESFVHTVMQRHPVLAAALLDCGFPETEDAFQRYLDIPKDMLSPGQEYVMVFDDCHQVYDRSVLRFLEQSIHAPFSFIKTILISREYPAINLEALTKKDGVAVIHEEDLRFTEDEIRGFMKQLDIPVSTQRVAEIMEGSQGWAFGVKLIMESMKRGVPNEKLAISAMRRNIFKYFESEIMGDLSTEAKKQVIRWSLVDHLPAETLDLKAFAAGDVELRKVSSFMRYDAWLNTWRIHPLFLEYLRQQTGILTEEEKRESYRKAIDWCLKNNFKMDAFSFLERVGDYEQLVDLSFSLPLAMPRNVARFLLEVLNRMPRQVFDENPDTWLLYGRCLLSMGRFEEAEKELRDIILRFEAMPQTSFVLRVLCVCHMNLGFSGLLTCLLTGDLGFCEEIEKGEDYFDRSHFARTDLNQVSRSAPGAILCRVREADPDLLERYIQALERSEPLLDRAMEGCLNGLALATRAEYAYYKGDMRGCVKFAEQAARLAKEKKQYDIEGRILFLLLRAALARGNYPEIQRILAVLEELGHHADYLNAQTDYDIITGWYHLMIGQPGRVADWILSPPDRAGDGSLVSGFEYITKIKYFLFQRRYEELLAYMESGQGKFGWKGYAIGRLELYVASAVALSKEKARERSMGLLLTAYEIAAPCGLDMAFIELGSDMRTLTAAALKSKDRCFSSEWLEKINRRSAAYAKNVLSVAAAYRKANGLEGDVKLTAREIDILSDLYHGLSRSEIAINRDLSINTVKSTLGILYSKLGAENTHDAIRIALDQKLI